MKHSQLPSPSIRSSLLCVTIALLIFDASIVCAQSRAPVIKSEAGSAVGNDKSASECLITVIGKDTGCSRCKDVKDDPRFPANSDKSKCPQIKYQSNGSGISKEVVARLIKDCEKRINICHILLEKMAL